MIADPLLGHAKMSSRHSSLTARILFSLSALAASLVAGSGMPLSHSEQPSTRLLHPRFLCLTVGIVLAAADSISTTPSFSHTPEASLALAALNATPLGRSLWLVSSTVAIDGAARRHFRIFLRC